MSDVNILMTCANGTKNLPDASDTAPHIKRRAASHIRVKLSLVLLIKTPISDHS
jgi:hypothetical protein